MPQQHYRANKLWGVDLSREELLSIAGNLARMWGFSLWRYSLGNGAGEIITPLMPITRGGLSFYTRSLEYRENQIGLSESTPSHYTDGQLTKKMLPCLIWEKS